MDYSEMSYEEAECASMENEETENRYDVEWEENGINNQNTDLSENESQELLKSLSARGIVGFETLR